MIDRKRLMWKLNEKNYMRTMHNQIRDGLIGTLREEYMRVFPAYTRDAFSKFDSMPMLRTMVDMMTANLLYYTVDMIVDLACDVLDKEDDK